MQATITPNGRRTGATWVAATGAFLLVAAAAVFVAVRWDELPDAMKLAVVGALTGSFLAGGRAVRRTLPATGDVLFHLGAFLLPVDLAGANLRAGFGWRPFLLTEGILGVLVLGGLGITTRSVVLEWAGATSMLAVAAGVAAVTPVPAPVVLAAIALIAASTSRTPSRAATSWATVAGAGPVLAALALWLLDGAAVPGAGVLRDLGLDGHSPWPLVIAGAAMSTFVLARQARRQEDAVQAFLAFGSAAIGAGAAWADAGITREAAWIGPAAAFLVVEVLALTAARDRFWRRLTGVVAAVGEVVASPTLVFSGIMLAVVPLLDATGIFRLRWTPNAAAGLAWALVALAWFTADLRRSDEFTRPAGLSLLVGSRTAFTTLPLGVAAVAAVAAGSASTVWTAAALIVMAAALVLSGRPFAGAVSALFCLWAPVVVWAHPVLGATAGAAGAAVLAAAAGLRLQLPTETGQSSGYFLAFAATVTVLEGCGYGPTRWVAPAAVVALWMVAVWLDRTTVPAGHIARATMVLLVAANVRAESAALVALTAAVATAVLAIDAIRLDRAEIGFGAALTVQAAVAAGAMAAGYALAPAGLVLCVSAVVWSGLAAVVDDRWRRLFVAAGAAAVAIGLLLATRDPIVLTEAMTVTGALAIAAGISLRVPELAHVGGAVTAGSLIARFALGGVSASEAYVAPVAAYLVAAGWQARRSSRISSWVAYGPAVGLLGGAALAERVAGGPGWHAVVAGAVGVIAVLAGGGRRLSGPLFIGTALLIVTTVHESLATLAGVPTWGWLALGGAVLLMAGIGMERSDRSPVESGRRLVDSISERFD